MIKDFFYKHQWVGWTLFILMSLGACGYLIHDSKKEEASRKESWNIYYENKYFVSIYDQLKRANKNAKEFDLENVTQAIIEDVQKKYEVTELSSLSNDSLMPIADKNSKVDVYDGEDHLTAEAYTEALILNIDLNK